MADVSEALAETARRHELSEGAVKALWDAVVAGRGLQAQFSHPDLGGMGQWSGGMLQIGDMFNAELKTKVAAICSDLAALASRSGEPSPSGTHQSQVQGRAGGGEAAGPGGFATQGDEPWWPTELGEPASSGAQNDTRYAVFPDRCRLAIERDGHVTIYDTGPHRISGFSQQQSTCSAMAFTSQSGPVMLDGLRVVPQ